MPSNNKESAPRREEGDGAKPRRNRTKTMEELIALPHPFTRGGKSIEVEYRDIVVLYAIISMIFECAGEIRATCPELQNGKVSDAQSGRLAAYILRELVPLSDSSHERMALLKTFQSSIKSQVETLMKIGAWAVKEGRDAGFD